MSKTEKKQEISKEEEEKLKKRIARAKKKALEKRKLREVGMGKKGFKLRKGQDRYEIKNVRGVGMWTWPAPGWCPCAICRNQMTEMCVECTASNKSEDECVIQYGVCNHSFHSHCIERWLQSRSDCPLCNTPYETQREEIDGN